jgi:hypothetical protein
LSQPRRPLRFRRIGPIRTAIYEGDQIPASVLSRDWSATAVALHPAGLVRAAADPRWRARAIVAYNGDLPVGVIGVHRPRVNEAYDPAYDPATLLGMTGTAYSRFAFVGGRQGSVAGAAFAPDLGTSANRARVERALFAAAVHEAADAVPVSFFLTTESVALFESALGGAARRHELASGAVLTVDFRDDEEYLSRLSSKRRKTVRVDREKLGRRGLRSETVKAAEAIPAAASLVQAVKEHHQVPDHEELIRYRLEEWVAGPGEEYLAFVVKDPSSKEIISVSFYCWHGTTLESHETGLRYDHPDVHLAYREGLFYGPIRHALEHGVITLDFGLSSLEPKVTRGARVVTLWAAGRSSV